MPQMQLQHLLFSQLGLGSVWAELVKPPAPPLWQGRRRALWKANLPLRKPLFLIVMEETQWPLSCLSTTPWCLAALTMSPCLSHPFLALVIEKHALGRNMYRKSLVHFGSRRRHV